jgi:Protein of unknown function (DUF3347)
MNSKVVVSLVSGAFLFGAAALADTKDPVIGEYFKVEQAVINQDLNAAKLAASDLAQKARAADNEAIAKDANDLAKTDSVDHARQIFKALSEETLNLIQGGEASQNTACSMGNAQCMQSQNSAAKSCMGQRMSGCGMMRNMCSGGCS